MKLGDAVEVFVRACKRERHSPHTIAWYECRLKSLVEFLDAERELDSIRLEDLRDWHEYLQARTTRWDDHPTHPQTEGGLAEATIHGCLRIARRFFRWLCEEEHLATNPAQRLKLPRLGDQPPKAVTPADMRAMLETAQAGSPREYAILCVFVDSGCRVGGLVGLRVADVDLGSGRAAVREKGRRSRTLFLSPETVEAIGAWLAERPDKGDRLFVGRKGNLTRSGVYQALKRIARLAGVKGRWNPHAFRHGAARGMLENGADLGTVSQLLGHRNVETTHEFYARWTTAELQRRHQRFSWLNGASEGE